MRGSLTAAVASCDWCLDRLLLRTLQWLEHSDHFVLDEMTELCSSLLFPCFALRLLILSTIRYVTLLSCLCETAGHMYSLTSNQQIMSMDVTTTCEKGSRSRDDVLQYWNRNDAKTCLIDKPLD